MRTGEDERSYGKEKYRMQATNCMPNGDILTAILHYICLLLSIIYISIYNTDTIYPSIRYIFFSHGAISILYFALLSVKNNKPS